MDDPIPTHHRKKQRKSNSRNTETEHVVVPDEESKKFTKRTLSSNWTKYDDNPSSNDLDRSHASDSSDFEKLLLAPVAIGGHFVFNSEKSWEATDDWYNRDEYFQLNLAELSKSLSTIPFYERQNYSKDIFSVEEIEAMDRQAKYQQFKWSSKNNSNSTVQLCKNPAADGKCGLNESQLTVINLPQNDDDDLDELLNLPGTRQQKMQSSSTASAINCATIQKSTTDPTDDIQKWLDDVLVLDS